MASSLLQESRKIYADNQEELDTHRAAAADDVKKLEALVERKAPLVDDSTGETPLHVAASRGSVKVIKWLLDKEVTSPFEKANNGNTAAHYAAVYGHFPALKLILTHNRSTGNQLAEQKDETGHTVASLAAVQGDEEMFQWIIEHFPKVGTIPNAHGNLPIHFAAASGSVNMLKLLVKKYGKEIAESVDAHKTKPIYFAAQEGKIDALSYLIDELRVDPEAMDEDGNVTIHAAALANQLETVKYLVSKLGPDCIVKKTSDGATPLHLAAGNGHISVLEFLLSKLSNKADVDVLDDIHATPAHDAVENGHTEALAVLLKYGADVNITDSVKKTPLDLAVEMNNTEMVNLLNEFSQNGQAALIKYKKNRTRKDSVTKVRTSKQEAEEVLEATVKSADIMEERKTRQLERQKSLQKMNEAADESSAHAEQGEEAKATVEHQNGPMGDIYARPNKKVHKRGPKKGQDGPDGSRATEAQGNSDELLDTKKGKTQESKSRSQGVSEQGIGVSLDTISNYSRPSRVKRHQDTESEHSYHSGVSSNNSYTHQSNVSASQMFAQQYVPYPGYPPMVPMMPHMGVANPMKQHSGSSISSRDGIQPGYPMPPYGPYGMYPPPMPGYGYYPGGGQYPPYPQLGYFHPRTTEERMHLAELQRGAVMHRGGGYPMPGGRRHNHRNASGESPTRLPRPDQDIGYGPTTDAVGTAQQSHQAHSEETDIHPPTPPITKRNGEESTTSDVVKFDSNFIMVKKDQQGSSVSKVGETTLNAAKHTLLVYDGRYDQYIMADPDDEEDIPEHCQVAFGAECAAILALACVVSFKGIEKQRIKKKSKQSNDKLNSSSQWDQPPTTNSSQLARRGSFTEELSKQIAQIAEDSNNKTGNTESELLSPDNAMTSSLHGQGFMSLSKQLGQKIISDSLWARNTSMMNIASTSLAGSRAGSRASLNQTSGEEDNLSDEDLDDADIVSIMEGVDPSETIRRKKLVAAQRKQQEGGQQDDAQKNKSAEESKSGTKGKKSSKYKESKSKKKKDRKGKSTAAAAGVEQEAVTVTTASDQSTTVSGGQDVSLVNADGKTENTKSSQDVLSQSGKVMESTQQMSSAVVILINDGKSSDTSRLDAKVNGTSSVKDAASAKQDITITKQDTTSAKKDAAITTTSVKQDIAITKQESTTSVKQNIATTKQDTTSARQDSISAEKGVATAQHAEGLAQKKLFKSGSVEVVNTAVLDDDDEEEDGDIPDLKTPPKAKPALKNKSQSVEEIMAGIDDIVSGMKDVFDDKGDTSVSTADSKLSRATHSSSSFTRSETAVQVSQTPSSTTPAVVTAASQANGTGSSSSSSDGTKIVVVHSGTTNGGDKDATTGEAKPSKLEMELLTALNTLQHTVDEIKSNSQLAPHAQQMQHDLIQKIFELNSSPEFIARILSLWSLSQLGQQTSGTMSKSNSHQMITTGLEQQLQRARESEHHSREAREAAAIHESKKEHHVQHAKNHDLHLNIREHIDSYLQTVLGKHFRKKIKDGKSSKKPVRKDSDSDEDEEDDEGMVTIEATPGTSKPASRTLHAERRQQPLLTEETPRPNSAGKKLLMRRGTNMDLHATTAALQNLTSPKASLDEEEDMKNFAVAKPVPIRRAVIHKQQTLEVSDVVPRPAPVNKVKSMVEQRVRNRS